MSTLSVNYNKDLLANNSDYEHPTGFYYRHESNFYKDYYGFKLVDEDNFILRWKNDKNTFVVNYDPEWPIKAKNEIDLLKNSIPCVNVEHIGSTAVEGMVARPTIDLIMSLSEDDFSNKKKDIIEKIVNSGYLYVDYEVRKDRLFFVKRQKDNKNGIPEFHLHVCIYDSNYHRIRIIFRDLLRSNDRIRERYCHDKLMIIQNYPGDRFVYYQAKTHFIFASVTVGRVDAAMASDAVLVGCDW